MSKAGKEKKLKRKDTGYPQPASAEPVWEHDAAFQVRTCMAGCFVAPSCGGRPESGVLCCAQDTGLDVSAWLSAVIQRTLQETSEPSGEPAPFDSLDALTARLHG